jgi:hypothetical protein
MSDYSWKQAQEDRGRQLNAFAAVSPAAPTPSEVLLAAADHIRDLAAAATAGVWTATDLTAHGHKGVWWVESEHHDSDGTMHGTVADLNYGESDARWIAALSPAIADDLAAVLRQVAAESDLRIAAWRSRPRPDGEVDRLIEQEYGAALRLSARVLGKEKP